MSNLLSKEELDNLADECGLLLQNVGEKIPLTAEAIRIRLIKIYESSLASWDTIDSLLDQINSSYSDKLDTEVVGCLEALRGDDRPEFSIVLEDPSGNEICGITDLSGTYLFDNFCELTEELLAIPHPDDKVVTIVVKEIK